MNSLRIQTQPSPSRQPVHTRKSKPLVILWIAIIFSAIFGAVLLSFRLDGFYAGLLACAFMLALLLIQVHIGVAMSLAGILAIYNQQGMTGFTSTLRNVSYESAASWSLSVIPMFILMAMFLTRSGITHKAYTSVSHWVGRLPGGLAVTTNLAGASLSAASGSTMGMAYAIGRVGLPHMLAAKYPPQLALASVLTVGTSSQLIPPSLLLVIYAGLAGTGVGEQLLAGLLPGIAMVTLNSVVFIAWAMSAEKRSGSSLGRMHSTWGQRFRSLPGIIPLLMLFIVVFGGLYSGIFTATEAGAVGAFLALIFLFAALRASSLQALKSALVDSTSTIGAIFLLIIGAAFFSRAMAVTGVTRGLTDWITSTGFSSVQFLLMMIVIYILLGMFLEPMSMMLLTVPVLIPVVSALGIDPIFFGVFTVLLAEIAHVTPPVGVLSYIVLRIAKETQINQGINVTLRHAMTAAAVFTVIGILMAIALIFLPELTTFLQKDL